MQVPKIIRNGLSAMALSAASLVIVSPAHAAMTFNFTFIAGTSVAAQNAFTAAGARWSTLFSDNITLDMTVGTAALGGSILAQAGSADQLYSYGAFRTALTSDRTSTDDFTAVASLQSGADFDVLINRTLDNPNGAGSAIPYEDTTGANNSNVLLNTANAKALGLSVNTLAPSITGCASFCDAFIQFNSDFGFDYNPNDGIAAGLYDFVGIATHELGHALGFTSGVDVLDGNSTGTFFSADTFDYVNSLDLFRYSAASLAVTAIDFTADTRSKFFSIDGGLTSIATFSTGRTYGDGNQASHWQDALGLGIMDPTAGTGELLTIVPNDIRALDVIGFTLAATPVPEPSVWMMMLAGFGLVGASLRRGQRPVARIG